ADGYLAVSVARCARMWQHSPANCKPNRKHLFLFAALSRFQNLIEANPLTASNLHREAAAQRAAGGNPKGWLGLPIRAQFDTGNQADQMAFAGSGSGGKRFDLWNAFDQFDQMGGINGADANSAQPRQDVLRQIERFAKSCA